MSCGGCRGVIKNNPNKKNPPAVDKRGNTLENYAYLNPNQLALREAQRNKEKENN
jgi:hypothetical protein